jgi:hypothetical protein
VIAFAHLRFVRSKQMFLIVGHLATPLSEAALANAAQRSCCEMFWSLTHAPPATSYPQLGHSMT